MEPETVDEILIENESQATGEKETEGTFIQKLLLQSCQIKRIRGPAEYWALVC